MAPTCGFLVIYRRWASSSWCRYGCGDSSARRIAAPARRSPSKSLDSLAGSVDALNDCDRRWCRSDSRSQAGRRPYDGHFQGRSQQEHLAEADRLAAGPCHRHPTCGRRGRIRPAQGPALRNCARRRRNTSPDRPPSGPRGRRARGLARRAARHRDRLPRPRSLLRRRRRSGRPSSPPGRRPMASLAQPGRSRGKVRLPAPWLLASHAEAA